MPASASTTAGPRSRTDTPTTKRTAAATAVPAKDLYDAVRTIRVVIHRWGVVPHPVEVSVPKAAGPCPESIHPGGVAHVRIDDVAGHEPGALPHYAPVQGTPTPVTGERR